MNISHFFAVIGMAALLVAHDAALAQHRFRFAWRNISFETPVAFSKPRAAGLDAVVLTAPPKAKVGLAAMEITLVAISAEMRESFGSDEAALRSFIVTTYLGLTGEGLDAPALAFRVGSVQGKQYAGRIPVPREIHLYLVPLSGGAQVAVALGRTVTSATAEQAHAVLLGIARTFTQKK
jgi:hypothetical protein